MKDFVEYYQPESIAKRKEIQSKENEEDRWRKYTYNEIIARDKTNLDIFWLKDENLVDLENLPEPDALIDEIIENIESALESFKTIKESIE